MNTFWAGLIGGATGAVLMLAAVAAAMVLLFRHALRRLVG